MLCYVILFCILGRKNCVIIEVVADQEQRMNVQAVEQIDKEIVDVSRKLNFHLSRNNVSLYDANDFEGIDNEFNHTALGQKLLNCYNQRRKCLKRIDYLSAKDPYIMIQNEWIKSNGYLLDREKEEFDYFEKVQVEGIKSGINCGNSGNPLQLNECGMLHIYLYISMYI